VAPVLLIFLRINEHIGQLLVGPNANAKFWAGPRCSLLPNDVHEIIS